MIFNGPQMHLMLNHLPIVGFIFLVPILLLVIWRGDDRIRRLALLGTFVVALLAIPAYLTGEPAEEGVEHLPGVTESAIHEHEEAAEASLVVALITGGLALAGYILGRRQPSRLRIATKIVFVGTLFASTSMAKVGHDGGKIRHPEITGSTHSDGGEGGHEGNDKKEDHDGAGDEK